jgi:hypothetical protein
MNLLSTKLHGLLDYTFGLTMVLMPWFLGFQENACERWLSIIVGVALLVYSFCTDYELGYLEEIDFRTHLLLDFLLGVALMVSPWLFGFYDQVYMPFLITGMVKVLSTIMTKIDVKPNTPGARKSRPLASNKTLAGI